MASSIFKTKKPRFRRLGPVPSAAPPPPGDVERAAKPPMETGAPTGGFASSMLSTSQSSSKALSGLLDAKAQEEAAKAMIPRTGTVTTFNAGARAASVRSGPGAPAVHPKDMGRSVKAALEVAVRQSRAAKPYLWGGGHGGRPAKVGQAVDCSGYVSMILGVSPRTSGGFMKWGQPGRGKHITVYANAGHVLVKVGKRWFATSRQNPGGGAGEIKAPSKSYLANFVARHPRGG